MAGQPVDRLDVEMVRRLVEEQQIEVTHKQGRQCHPSAFSTGEPVDAATQVKIAYQAGDDVSRTRICRPLVGRQATEHDSAHGRSRIHQVVLAEHSPAQIPGLRHAPGVYRLQPRNDFEQCGLAVPVTPNDADPVASLHSQAHLGEERAYAVRLRHLLEVHEVRCGRGHGGSTISRPQGAT